MAASLSSNIHEISGLLQSGAARTSGRLYYAFAQQCQLQELPSIQRKRNDLFLVDYIADLCSRALQKRFAPSDRDLIGYSPDLKREVKIHCLPELKNDSAPHQSFEAVAFDRDCVLTDRQRGKEDNTPFACHALKLDPASCINQRDRDTRQYRPSNVLHRSSYLRGIRLRGGDPNQQ